MLNYVHLVFSDKNHEYVFVIISIEFSDKNQQKNLIKDGR